MTKRVTMHVDAETVVQLDALAAAHTANTGVNVSRVGAVRMLVRQAVAEAARAASRRQVAA